MSPITKAPHDGMLRCASNPVISAAVIMRNYNNQVIIMREDAQNG
jgi:hypothetical protein